MFWVPKLGKFAVLFGKHVLSIRKQCLVAIEAISRLPGTVFHERIGSYRHIQKIPSPKNDLMAFYECFSEGGPQLLGDGPSKDYETKYCVCRLVIWHDVWRHVGLSDAKNSNEKGTECKKLFKFYCFFAMFFIFGLCVPGFSKITFVILDEFCFCFLHFVQFTNPDYRAIFHLKVQFHALFGSFFFFAFY